jgi:hypothetical protein
MYIINFLVILIIWNFIFLIIKDKDKENFILHTFTPWGATLQACVNRCEVSSDQKISTKDCNMICNKCTSDNCYWKNPETNNVIVDNNTKENDFKIQVIPGTNNAIIRWTYSLNSDNVNIDSDKIEFEEEESFILSKEDNTKFTFTYDNIKKFFCSKCEDNQTSTTPSPETYYIVRTYELINNFNYSINNNNENSWYLINKTDDSATLFNENSLHPLNNLKFTTIFTKKRKQILNITKFIIQLVNADNIENGVTIIPFEPTSQNEQNNDSKFSHTIENLNINTNYKLSMYPLFDKKIQRKYLSDIINFSTNDNKFILN